MLTKLYRFFFPQPVQPTILQQNTDPRNWSEHKAACRAARFQARREKHSGILNAILEHVDEEFRAALMLFIACAFIGITTTTIPAMGQTTSCFVTGNTTTCSTPVSNGITTIGHETTTCTRYGNNITCNAGRWNDVWNQQATQNAASAGAGIVNIIGSVIERHHQHHNWKQEAASDIAAFEKAQIDAFVSKHEADIFVQRHPEYADTIKNALLMKSIWLASGITYPALAQFEQCYKQLRASNLIELVPAPKAAR